VADAFRQQARHPLEPSSTPHRLSGKHAIVTGDSGRAFRVEIIAPMALAATNHFIARIDGVWRLVHHQSSPITQMVSQALGDAPFRRRQVR